MASKLCDDFRAIVNSRSDRPKEYHTIVNKLKAFLDEKLSLNDSRIVRREFLEKEFTDIVRLLFADSLKDLSLFGQLIQNCPSICEYMNASDTSKYKASHPPRLALELFKILDPDTTSGLLAPEPTRALPFSVDALPAAVYNVVAGRGSRTDPLLECLVRHHLLLEAVSTDAGRVPAGRQPPTTKSLPLHHLAYFLLSALRFPTMRVATSSSSIGSSSSSSVNRSSSRPKTVPILSAMTTKALCDTNPYNWWFVALLRHYLPLTQTSQPVKPLSEFVFFAVCTMLLAGNDPDMFKLAPSSEYVSSKPVNGAKSVLGSPTIAPTVVTSQLAPTRASVGSSTPIRDYVKPELHALECVVLFVLHLLADSDLSTRLRPDVASDSPAPSFSSPKASIRAPLQKAYVPISVTPTLERLQRFAFDFFRISMANLPVNDASESFVKFVDTWLVYITPWDASSRVAEDGRSSRYIAASAADTSDAGYSGTWERYVVLNYMFYSHILSLFLKRMTECDYSTGNEDALALLKRVMDVFQPRVTATLSRCSRIIDTHDPASGRVSGRHSDLFQKLLSDHAKMLGVTFDQLESLSHAEKNALSLSDRMELGIRMGEERVSKSRSSGALQQQKWRQLRGGAGWCDGFIERVLNLVFSVVQTEPPKPPLCLSKVKTAVAAVKQTFVVSNGSGQASGPLAELDSLSALPPRTATKRDASQSRHGPGLVRYSPLDVEFQGPSSLRPVGTYEVAFLVGLSHRLALWLHVLFDEPRAAITDMNAKIAEIESAQAELLAAVKRHEVDHGLMTRLRQLEGPRRTYIRVLLGDLRFFLPLLALWLYVTASLVGTYPALGLFGFLVVTCVAWL